MQSFRQPRQQLLAHDHNCHRNDDDEDDLQDGSLVEWLDNLRQ